MLIFLSMLESDEERRLFTDLYNQYGNMMLHVAKRYFPKDMYAAEDVVQNAWIRVVDHFQKIQAVPSKKRGAYLVVIVRNEASLAYSNPKKLMDAELDYLIVSMNTVGNWFKPDNNQSKYGTSETLTASQFKVSNKSADILARIFCGHYERPGVPKISERVANAKKWYNFL